MPLPRNEAELRVFVREACQRFVKLTTKCSTACLRTRHLALIAQEHAVVAMRKVLKRKGLSSSQIETEVLALQS